MALAPARMQAQPGAEPSMCSSSLSPPPVCSLPRLRKLGAPRAPLRLGARRGGPRAQPAWIPPHPSAWPAASPGRLSRAGGEGLAWPSCPDSC